MHPNQQIYVTHFDVSAELGHYFFRPWLFVPKLVHHELRLITKPLAQPDIQFVASSYSKQHQHTPSENFVSAVGSAIFHREVVGLILGPAEVVLNKTQDPNLPPGCYTRSVWIGLVGELDTIIVNQCMNFVWMGGIVHENRQTQLNPLLRIWLPGLCEVELCSSGFAFRSQIVSLSHLSAPMIILTENMLLMWQCSPTSEVCFHLYTNKNRVWDSQLRMCWLSWPDFLFLNISEESVPTAFRKDWNKADWIHTHQAVEHYAVQYVYSSVSHCIILRS